MLLFYDTETTGLPRWSSPSIDDAQPHVVQIGAILVDEDSREIVDELDVIVKPASWDIPQAVINIHKITNEYAMAHGIEERAAIAQLLDMFFSTDSVKRVAYNQDFDQRIIRIGLKRYFDKDVQRAWASGSDHICAMESAKDICKIGTMSSGGFKNPRLKDAYKYFTGDDLENAHNAVVDAKATMKVYFACVDYEKKGGSDE